MKASMKVAKGFFNWVERISSWFVVRFWWVGILCFLFLLVYDVVMILRLVG
jgi:hypothetical protein